MRITRGGLLKSSDAAGTYAPISEKVFRAVDYGVTMDGTTDDRAALLAAVTATVAYITANSRPATLLLGKGTLYLGTGVTIAVVGTDPAFTKCGVPLPVGLPAMLTIRGEVGGPTLGTGRPTVVKMSDACRNVFWINKTADYDTFKNVTISDLDVDNNNTVGLAHILLGNMPSDGSRQKRLNYADLNVRRVGIYNVPVDPTVLTTNKYGVCLIGQHANTGQDGTIATQLTMEATQTSTLRVDVEDVEQTGGGGAVAVTSWMNMAGYQGTGPTNHYYDRIHFRRLRHLITAVPTGSFHQTSFFMTGAGVGNYGEITDVYSENIADDAVEVGPMQTLVMDRVRVKNPVLTGILMRISQPPLDVNSQRFLITRSRCDVTSALAASTAARGMPWECRTDNGCVAGTIDVQMDWSSDGQTYSVTQNPYLYATIIADIQRVIIRNPKITISNYTYDWATSQDVALINVNTVTNDRTAVDIDKMDVRLVSFAITGTNGVQLHAVLVNGTRPRVNIDGIDSDMSGISGATAGLSSSTLLSVGKSTATSIRVLARGLRPRKSAGSGARWGVRVYSNGLDQLLVEDSNFGSGTGLGGDIDLASASTNAAKVFVRDVIGLTGSRLGPGGRRATAANYTMLAFDVLVGVTSTASARTITMPAANAVLVGQVFTVVDESNAAGTNNITVQRAGTDTFTDAATSKVISTNGGSLKFFSTGSAWVLV